MIVDSDFKPPWWLRNAHLQTLWPFLLRSRPKVETRRERLELPDGDFLDLDFTPNDHGPVVLVLHGLQGSIRSKYAAGLLKCLSAAGYRAVLMHFRGCSGEPNRRPRGYHSGETGDPAFVIKYLRQRFPDTPIAAVGFSLGGNALLKLLAEQGKNGPIDTAVAVSVPFQLDQLADRLNQGFARLYREYLLRSLIRATERKHARMDLAPVNIDAVRRCRDFWDFDTEVTAKLHGFRDAADYYHQCSCRRFLADIHKPVLILHAGDDPFMTPDTVPTETELSNAVTLELSRHGGHVGFVAGRWPGSVHYWLEARILRHLQNNL